MEKALIVLMELQKLDKELGGIVSLRGDLPQQVEELNRELASAKKAVEEVGSQLESCRIERNEKELEVQTLVEKKNKYQEQLYAVKTNREYDAVTMELESVRIASEAHETTILELMEKEKILEAQKAEKKTMLEDVQAAFEGKRAALEEAIAKTEKEETALRDQRIALASQIEPRMLNTYERILKAKHGMAVAPVIKTACSGCFTNLPPQHVLEVRQMKRLKLCETCGRMLVWDPDVSEGDKA